MVGLYTLFSVLVAVAPLATAVTFPTSIGAKVGEYKNWARNIDAKTYMGTANNPQDVVDAANWAAANGWRLRASGTGHSWSTTLLDASVSPNTNMLVLSMLPLNNITVDAAAGTMSCGAGAHLDDVHNIAKANNMAFGHTPANGEITLVGAIATSAHGAGTPADGEIPTHTLGSMSETVTELDAVVFDSTAGAYVLKTFKRDADADITAFLTSLGRSAITRVTVKPGPGYNMRCQSTTAVKMSEVCGAPGSTGKTFASYLAQTGRIELTLQPYTDYPWLKIWSIAPTKPVGSKAVTGPYNYGFATTSETVSNIVSATLRKLPGLTKAWSAAGALTISGGLLLTGKSDLWGAAADLLRYAPTNTLKTITASYAVHCKRADVQRVVYEFNTKYQAVLAAQASAGTYGINTPLTIRATSVDSTMPLPDLAASRPFEGSGFDTVVWLAPTTIVEQPHSDAAFAELEQWAYANYAPYAAVRPEWAKGWAYTAKSAWTDPTIAGKTIPASFGPHWQHAVSTLAKYDPKRIYASPLLDLLGL